jgi:hypothetical protein
VALCLTSRDVDALARAVLEAVASGALKERQGLEAFLSNTLLAAQVILLLRTENRYLLVSD